MESLQNVFKMQLPPRLEDTKVHKEFIFNDLFFGATLRLGAFVAKKFLGVYTIFKIQVSTGNRKD